MTTKNETIALATDLNPNDLAKTANGAVLLKAQATRFIRSTDAADAASIQTQDIRALMASIEKSLVAREAGAANWGTVGDLSEAKNALLTADHFCNAFTD